MYLIHETLADRFYRWLSDRLLIAAVWIRR